MKGEYCMKIPDTIKIGPFTYNIVVDSVTMDSKNSWGESRHIRRQITLKGDWRLNHPF